MPTVTGRAANFLSSRLDPLARLTSRTHTKQYRATKGRYWKKLLRKPVILADVDVMWIWGAQTGVELDAARAKLQADSGYIGLIDRAGGLFVPGSATRMRARHKL